MKYRLVCALHAGVAMLFLAGPLTLSVLTFTHPAFVPGAAVIGASVLSFVLLMSVWGVCGDCPLTRWENRCREEIGLEPLDSSWVDHYLDKMFGASIHPDMSGGLQLVCMIVVPIASGITSALAY